MSLPQASQSRVFVELVPWADRSRENHVVSGGETLPALRRPLSSSAAAQAQTSGREVHVSGAAEVSAGPDRAQVAVRVSSTKEAAAEAKKSVCRRLDYIAQSLQQQGLPVSARRGGGGVRWVAEGPAPAAPGAGRGRWAGPEHPGGGSWWPRGDRGRGLAGGVPGPSFLGRGMNDWPRGRLK